MKKITEITGAGAKLRGRSRSVKLRVLEIARAARAKTARTATGGAGLPKITRGTPGGRASQTLPQGRSTTASSGRRKARVKPCWKGLRRELQGMVPVVQQVIR
jgi:IS5 family transposase